VAPFWNELIDKHVGSFESWLPVVPIRIARVDKRAPASTAPGRQHTSHHLAIGMVSNHRSE
jgi:hypothetical protein